MKFCQIRLKGLSMVPGYGRKTGSVSRSRLKRNELNANRQLHRQKKPLLTSGQRLIHSMQAAQGRAGIIRVISRIISLARYAVIAGVIITFAYQFTHKNEQPPQAVTDEPDLTGLKIPDIKVPSQLTGCAGPLRTHPDGRPWGTLAKIMTVAENHSGLSSLTLDNSKNSQDLYVKLAQSVDQNTHNFVREAFIPAHQQLTLQHLAVGNYVVKMMNVANGCAQVSPVLSIEETRTGRGIEYSNHSMTLNPVINGNTHLSTLSAANF
ncbi:hypothetical protein BB778_04505 [Pluralibacter gergoviae]|nr:hypothetical protein BB778_04505 [Pluralibacter gergoviae]